MDNWWVNQNQTYKAEVQGGFLWSPKTNRDGRRNQFYENMRLVRPGDLVFSFCDTKIKAIGVARGPAQSADKPNSFGNSGDYWDHDGWLVPVEFTEVDNEVRPKDFIDELRPYLPSKYSPLQSSGDGNQGVYLAAISDGFSDLLLQKIGLSRSHFLQPSEIEDEIAENTAQNAIEGRTDIGDTQKQQLVQARRGQGIFKANVRLNESKCRFTGVTDPRLLIASHIKPWAVSNDREKLDGCNGLLFSPHVDRLFDRGFIGFKDDGTVLYSPSLDRTVLRQWAIDNVANVGSFMPEQCVYLEYHRSSRFQWT